ncbi:unnamed protein product [Phytomonas sp. Hart1]|nr:unnamed protein product [Phytomonas sp. Hart1]|eukprot:CCW70714.1 unnamed protein product [Phytomonas sp. isolate Hart1]
MGFSTAKDVWLAPIQRDWPLFISFVIFWFGVQFFSGIVLRRIIPGWERFSASDQKELKQRACSALNGIIMSGSSVIFICNLYLLSFKLLDDLYQVVDFPIFSVYRVAIVAYFTWDVIVCFTDNWSLTWKIHGICSLIGVYCLWFPYADVYAGFYTGCYEINNFFFHVSITLHMVASNNIENPKVYHTCSKYAAWFEYIFAFLFVLIRCVFSTILTCFLMKVALRNLYEDILNRNTPGYTFRTHDELACVLSTVGIFLVQGIQYYWLSEIVNRAVKIFYKAKKKS